MKAWDRVVAWTAMIAALTAAIWIGGLLFKGVELNRSYCRYLVPVEHHPGVYTCSPDPKPVKP